MLNNTKTKCLCPEKIESWLYTVMQYDRTSDHLLYYYIKYIAFNNKCNIIKDNFMG